MDNVCIAGGVGLNCVANWRILKESGFKNIFIQPAAGDSGAALGAAFYVYNSVLVRPRVHCMDHAYLGPGFDENEIGAVLRQNQAAFERIADEGELLRRTAELIAGGKVIGWFQGRMEFGPRALGARSIIGDPRSPKMQATMNLKIKFRESFRPFAPIVLQEEAHRWFDLEPGQESPYMLLVAPVLEERRIPIAETDLAVMARDPDLRNRVNIPRSEIPAVTHVDYSARIQTVDEGRHPRLTQLLRAFRQRTGCPVLVNTSFNVRGEPIVCTPEDAYRCFLGTEMDALVVGNFVLLKEDATGALDAETRERYLAQFQLD
jgi:carbamoyltransferase